MSIRLDPDETLRLLDERLALYDEATDQEDRETLSRRASIYCDNLRQWVESGQPEPDWSRYRCARGFYLGRCGFAWTAPRPIDHAEDGRPVYKRSEVVADAKRLAAGGGTCVLSLRRTP